MLETFLERRSRLLTIRSVYARSSWRVANNIWRTSRYLLHLQNSTWRNLFFAASNDLCGPPRFISLRETTLYPALTFLIIATLVGFHKTWPTRDANSIRGP